MELSLESVYGERYSPAPYDNEIVATYSNNIQGRPDWMPDPSVQLFVESIIKDIFPLETQVRFFEKPEWVPLSVLSTLEWIKIGGWWLFQYTKVGLTDEQYKSIWSYIEDGIIRENDPTKLLIFNKDPNRCYFKKRCDDAGLTEQEFSDLLPFVKNISFPSWKREAPPEDILEVVIWCTLLWVLSDDAEEWCEEMEILYDFTNKQDWSFLSSEEEVDSEMMRLLSPLKMQRENRPVGSCSRCGTQQWCIDGYVVISDEVTMRKSEQTTMGSQNWQYLCNFCAVELNQISGFQLADDNVSNPMCGNTKCLNTSCPNLKTAKDRFGNILPELLLERGRQRVNEYKNFIEANGGTPRQLTGQTVDQILAHFQPTGWK